MYVLVVEASSLHAFSFLRLEAAATSCTSPLSKFKSDNLIAQIGAAVFQPRVLANIS